jgi:hypothetical protein
MDEEDFAPWPASDPLIIEHMFEFCLVVQPPGGHTVRRAAVVLPVRWRSSVRRVLACS